MNARERVLTTLQHKEPDRVPLFFNGIDAKLIRQLGTGTMVDTWKYLDVDVFVLGRTAWCDGIPTGSGYLPDPPPPEESLGGSIYAGWNGIDEFGRVWKHEKCYRWPLQMGAADRLRQHRKSGQRSKTGTPFRLPRLGE